MPVWGDCNIVASLPSNNIPVINHLRVGCAGSGEIVFRLGQPFAHRSQVATSERRRLSILARKRQFGAALPMLQSAKSTIIMGTFLALGG